MTAVSSSLLKDLGRAARIGWRRELPPRYLYRPEEGPAGFRSRVREAVGEGCAVLDLGAGAKPVLEPGDRPRGSRYVGLDISEDELRGAPPGSYDETVVADAAEPVPALEGGFDVVVSWFALEHVRPVDQVIRNVRQWLRPGGRFIAYCSGRYAPASILNRALPASVGRGPRLRRAIGREGQTIHRAYYDRCTHSGLVALFGHGWERAEVVPVFTGSKYVRFSRPLHAAYLAYEELIWRTNRRDLAPYLLIDSAVPINRIDTQKS